MATCSVVKHLADSSVQGTLSDDYSVGIYMDTLICYLGNTQELCSILARESRLQKSYNKLTVELMNQEEWHSGEKVWEGG